METLKRLVVALILLAAAQSAIAAEKWWEAQVGEFHIVSMIGRDETAGVVRDIQVFQMAVEKFLPIKNRTLNVPVTLYVFDLKFWNTFVTNDKKTAGLAHLEDDRIVLLVQGGEWTLGATILFHELTHAYMHRNFKLSTLPKWLDEGYGDFMSTVSWDKNTIMVGLPAAWRYQAIQGLPWIPLSELLGIDEWTGPNTDERSHAFYAQSWLMVHFVMFGDAGRVAQIQDYLDAIAGGSKPKDAFAKAFPNDRGQFENELKSYSRQRNFKFLRYPVENLPVKSVSTVSLMNEEQAGDALAEWMMRYNSMDPPEMKLLEERHAKYPKNRLATVQLGMAYADLNRVADAEHLIAEGCSTEEISYLVAYYCAEATLRTERARVRASDKAAGRAPAGFEDVEGRLDSSAVLRARSFYLTSLQQYPTNLSALFGAARTFSRLSGDARLVIDGLEQAKSRNPQSARIAYSLAGLYRYSDLAKSREYLRRAVQQTSDEKWIAAMRDSIQQLDDEIAKQK